MSGVVLGVLDAFFGLLGTKVWLWWLDLTDRKDAAVETSLEEGHGGT